MQFSTENFIHNFRLITPEEGQQKARPENLLMDSAHADSLSHFITLTKRTIESHRTAAGYVLKYISSRPGTGSRAVFTAYYVLIPKRQKKHKTTGDIYDQQRRCDNLLQKVTTAQIKKADPDTGGNQMLCHNWGNDAARVFLDRHQDRQVFLYNLFNKYYKLAFYREYPEHVESIKYRKTVTVI